MDGVVVRGMEIRAGRMPGAVVRDSAIAAVMDMAMDSFAADIIQDQRFMADRLHMVADSMAARSTAVAGSTVVASAADIGKKLVSV